MSMGMAGVMKLCIYQVSPNLSKDSSTISRGTPRIPVTVYPVEPQTGLFEIHTKAKTLFVYCLYFEYQGSESLDHAQIYS